MTDDSKLRAYLFSDGICGKGKVCSEVINIGIYSVKRGE